MDVLTTKVLATVLMGVITFVCGLIPLKVKNYLESLEKKKRDKILSCLLCLGAGVLLATVFMHILPETREGFLKLETEAHDENDPRKGRVFNADADHVHNSHDHANHEHEKVVENVNHEHREHAHDHDEHTHGHNEKDQKHIHDHNEHNHDHPHDHNEHDHDEHTHDHNEHNHDHDEHTHDHNEKNHKHVHDHDEHNHDHAHEHNEHSHEHKPGHNEHNHEHKNGHNEHVHNHENEMSTSDPEATVSKNPANSLTTEPETKIPTKKFTASAVLEDTTRPKDETTADPDVADVVEAINLTTNSKTPFEETNSVTNPTTTFNEENSLQKRPDTPISENDVQNLTESKRIRRHSSHSHEHDSDHSHEHSHEHSHSYPYAELSIIVGFLLIYLLEELLHKMCLHSNTDDKLVAICDHGLEAGIAGTYSKHGACHGDGSTQLSTFSPPEVYTYYPEKQYSMPAQNGNNGLAPKSAWAKQGIANPVFTGDADATTWNPRIKDQLVANHQVSTEFLENSKGPVFSIDEPDSKVAKKKPTLLENIRSLLLVIAISFHAVFEGMALGLQEYPEDVWYLFTAISAHKFVIVFCIGVELTAVGTSFPIHLLYVTILAMISPVGAGIGIFITDLSNLDPFSHTLVTVVLQGIAAGTLLYVAIFEVLERERHKPKNRLLKWFFLVLGFAIMAVFGYFFAHKH